MPIKFAEVTIPPPAASVTNAKLCTQLWETLDPTMARQYTLINAGRTGYIDYLQLNDFDRSVVVGKDVAERRFVTAKVRVETYEKGEVIDTEEGMYTVHERYAGRSDLWVSAGGLSNSFPSSPTDLTTEDMASLVKLLRGDVRSVSIISYSTSSRIFIMELI